MEIKYILTTPTVITREMKRNMERYPSLRSLIHLGSIRVGPLSFGPGSSMTVGEPFYRKWKKVIDTAMGSGLLRVHTLIDGKVTETAEKGKKTLVGQEPKELSPKENPVADKAKPVDTIVAVVEPVEEEQVKEEEPERAREDDGTFVADDPETPDVDEAWEDGVGPVEEEVEEPEVAEEPKMSVSDLNKMPKKKLVPWLLEKGISEDKLDGLTKKKLVDLALDNGLVA